MRKLMAANLFRLWKNKVFWLGMLLMLAYSLVNMLNGCRQATRDMSEFGYALEHYYFTGMPLVGIFIAVFAGLFLGTEYSDGTMRNKLVIGHTRVKVYLANLLTAFIASLLMLTMWFVGGLAGIPILGVWKMSASALMTYAAISILMAAALCAIFTLVCMLSSNRAVTAVLCILLWLGVTVLGAYFYNMLCEPETYSGMVITADGMQMGEPVPNPNYVSGTKRKVYEFMEDFIPVSQGILMADLAVERPVRMMLSSTFIAALTTLCGIILFRRKDLK